MRKKEVKERKYCEKTKKIDSQIIFAVEDVLVFKFGVGLFMKKDSNKNLSSILQLL